MKLIVGLGNPGKEYEKTRHNAGFIVIDEIARTKATKIDKKKFNCLYGEFFHNKEKVILLKPQTFMNLSGNGIKAFSDYFNIELKNILIIYDDYYLEVGKFLIKPEGSSAGHNGLKSIEKTFSTNKYKRIKVGISRDKQMLLTDYVLGKLSWSQSREINKVKKEIAQIIDDYLDYDFEKFMSLHNKR